MIIKAKRVYLDMYFCRIKFFRFLIKRLSEDMLLIQIPLLSVTIIHEPPKTTVRDNE